MNIETIRTKVNLEKVNYHKKVYFYRVHDKSDKKGFNRMIEVCIQEKDFTFLTLCYVHINTESYKGDKATARNAISDIMKHRMLDGYSLKSKTIKVIEF